MLVLSRIAGRLRSTRKSWLMAGLAISACIASYSAVYTPFPPPNAPFYANLGPGMNAIHDPQWAVIPFYTNPSCVPRDFNLLNFFDIPRAFDCPLTTHGLSIWKNGPPPVDEAPIQNVVIGNGAVHVWFVRWSEFQVAMQDGVLTMPELEGMLSLRRGLASFFHETVHPLPDDPAFVKLDVLTANGTLTDGTPFLFQAAFTTERGAWKFHSVRVDFR
jgi:hypothetical protein